MRDIYVLFMRGARLLGSGRSSAVRGSCGVHLADGSPCRKASFLPKRHDLRQVDDDTQVEASGATLKTRDHERHPPVGVAPRGGAGDGRGDARPARRLSRSPTPVQGSASIFPGSARSVPFPGTSGSRTSISISSRSSTRTLPARERPSAADTGSSRPRSWRIGRTATTLQSTPVRRAGRSAAARRRTCPAPGPRFGARRRCAAGRPAAH